MKTCRAFRSVAWLLLCSVGVQHLAASRIIDEGPFRVENVVARNDGSRVFIRYDLRGPETGACRVWIRLLRKNNPAFLHTPLLGLRGAIGDTEYLGTDKTIEWNFLEEFPNGLSGDDFFFEVLAEPVAQGGINFWYIAAAVGAVGGGVVLLLWKKPSPPPPQIAPDIFPSEPGRP